MDYKKLSEVANITMGQSPSSESYNLIGEGVPFFQGKADFGKINPSVRMYCNAPSKMAYPNEVLMSVRAPVGDVNISNVECCIGRGLAAISAIEQILDSKYLFYVLQMKKEQISALGTGSTFKAINKGILEQIEVPMVDIVIQKKIVSVLERAQELIDKRKEQIQACDELIKSQFIEMFGDIQSNPLKWEEVTFGDVSKVRQGLQIPISKRKTEPGVNCLPYITIQYLNGGKDAEYIENPKENVICTVEDILMTRTGNTGMVISGISGVFHNNFFLIDFDRTILNRVFLVEYLKSNFIQADIIRRAGTSTIPDLNHGEFYKIKVYLPPIELQNEFAQFVQRVNKLKFEMEQSFKRLKDNFCFLESI